MVVVSSEQFEVVVGFDEDEVCVEEVVHDGGPVVEVGRDDNLFYGVAEFACNGESVCRDVGVVDELEGFEGEISDGERFGGESLQVEIGEPVTVEVFSL